MKIINFLLPVFLSILVLSSKPVCYAHGSRLTSFSEKPGYVLKGQIKRYTGKSVVLVHSDSSGEDIADTIPVKNGLFFIPKKLILNDQIAFLYFNCDDNVVRVQIPVLLSPNYHLHLLIDSLVPGSNQQVALWQGQGSKTNTYYTSIFKNFQNIVPADSKFNSWYNTYRVAMDSLFVAYGRRFVDKNDTQFYHFKDMIHNEVIFQRVSILMRAAYIMFSTQPPNVIKAFVERNFDPGILKNISDERYLLSPAYRELMGFDYSFLFYLVKYDIKTKPDTLKDHYVLYLEKISQVYHGKVKDFVLHRFINLNLVNGSNSFEKFSEHNSLTQPYLTKIKNKKFSAKLQEDIAEKLLKLSKLKIGDVAPNFSLNDNYGKVHQLKDFRGRIVLIDFWASSCAPCRSATKYVRALEEKFKPSNQVVIISVDIRDSKTGWEKALLEDQPDWLQLHDDNDITKNYFTNGIPKFVLIDGSGNIITLDAQDPEDSNQLENLITSALTKVN